MVKLIGIAGGTCSGKTTLAQALKAALGDACAVIPMDNYYRASDDPLEIRAEMNHDLPEAFDWPLLLDHVRRLAAGETVQMPVYCYREHNRTERIIELKPAEVIVLEGIFTLYKPELLESLHLAVFLDSSAEQRRERRLKRDIVERNSEPDYTLRKFNHLVEPAYCRFVEPTKAVANIVTSNLEVAERKILEALERSDEGKISVAKN